MAESEYVKLESVIGIDRKAGCIKMVFDHQIGDSLIMTPDEADRVGVSLIGRAAILRGFNNEDQTKTKKPPEQGS
jgi:hypothetical protein